MWIPENLIRYRIMGKDRIESKPKLKEKIKFEVLDGEAGMLLIDILEQKPECSFCGEKITKENFGGIFSLPTRVCCNNICCIIEALPQD